MMPCLTHHPDKIRRALDAWQFAKPNRSLNRSWKDGKYLCELIEGGEEPIVGTSEIGWTDAAAQALMIADRRDFSERYGTEEWQRLGALLAEMQEMAR